MKKVYGLVLGLIFMASGACLYAFLLLLCPTQGDNLLFEETRISIGSVARNTADVKRSFKFQNFGKRPVGIASIKVSCGCSTADYSKKEFLPGEKGEIVVFFHPQRRDPGLHLLDFFVTAEPASEHHRLQLEVYVHEPIRVVPGAIDYGDYVRGAAPPRFTLLLNYSMNNLSVEQIESKNGFVQSPQSELAIKAAKAARIDIQPTGSEPAGRWKDTVSISINAADSLPITLHVSGRTHETAIYCKEASVDFGFVKNEQSPPRTIHVKALTALTFKVAKVSARGGLVRAEFGGDWNTSHEIVLQFERQGPAKSRIEGTIAVEIQDSNQGFHILEVPFSVYLL